MHQRSLRNNNQYTNQRHHHSHATPNTLSKIINTIGEVQSGIVQLIRARTISNRSISLQKSNRKVERNKNQQRQQSKTNRRHSNSNKKGIQEKKQDDENVENHIFSQWHFDQNLVMPIQKGDLPLIWNRINQIQAINQTIKQQNRLLHCKIEEERLKRKKLQFKIKYNQTQNVKKGSQSAVQTETQGSKTEKNNKNFRMITPKKEKQLSNVKSGKTMQQQETQYRQGQLEVQSFQLVDSQILSPKFKGETQKDKVQQQLSKLLITHSKLKHSNVPKLTQQILNLFS